MTTTALQPGQKLGWGFHGITAGEGPEPADPNHSGLDFVIGIRGDVHAIAAGEVIALGKGSIPGNSYNYQAWVAIEMSDGRIQFWGELASVSLTRGDEVKLGQIIGKASAKWPHLSIFGVWGKPSTLIDPAKYIDANVELSEAAKDAIHDNKVMAIWLNHLNAKNKWGLPATDASKTGKRSGSYWKLLKRAGKARGDYDGKLTTAGPTDATAKLERIYRDDAVEYFKAQS